MPNANTNIRRSNDLMSGRLIAMPTTAQGAANAVAAAQNSYQNILSVDFPAMPDIIELARRAEYKVTYSPTQPDGIHQYAGTTPLEIPISFKLHSFDKQYCKHGALTLLQLAARLHSFVLPINTAKTTSSTASNATQSLVPPAFSIANFRQRLTDSASMSFGGASSASAPNSTGPFLNGGSTIYSPVVCPLQAIYIDSSSPGICALGYVKDVNVKLGGPWLRGPNNSYNLPSCGEFAFTFVHVPSQGNDQGATAGEVSNVVSNAAFAYADDVRELLYNTRALVGAVGYQSFADNPDNTTSDD
jgi:hypothetical protein